LTPTLLLRVVAGRRLIDLLGRLLLAGGLLLRGTLEVIVHRRRVEVLEPLDRLVLRWVRHASAVPTRSDFTPDRAGTSVRARKFVGIQVRAVHQWRRWREPGYRMPGDPAPAPLTASVRVRAGDQSDSGDPPDTGLTWQRIRSLTDARTPDELTEMAHQLRA